MSSVHPEQQAENGLINTNNIAQRNPIGKPNISNTKNHIILQNHPQLAIMKVYLVLSKPMISEKEDNNVTLTIH